MKKMTTRDHVLSVLEHNKGKYVTGTALAYELKVSRNAIWKAINSLKEDGYSIESVNNKGYCLDTSNDRVSVIAIKEALTDICDKNDVERIIDSIIVFDSLESTNLTAKLELITGSMNKKIIIARKQTAGVGHGSKVFDSPEGGIYMSIIIDDLQAGKTLSSSFIGNTVKNIIEKLSGQTAVLDKKYNRISIGNKKVCGILTEYFADLETNTINGYIIGIGIKNIDIPKNELIARIVNQLK